MGHQNDILGMGQRNILGIGQRRNDTMPEFSALAALYAESGSSSAENRLNVFHSLGLGEQALGGTNRWD